MESIRRELAAIDRKTDWYELLAPGRRAVLLADNLDSEVNNGGFDQFFHNSSGDGAHFTPDSLCLLGLERPAAMVERANRQFPNGPSPSREARLAQMDTLPAKARQVWSRLDHEFFKLKFSFGGMSVGAGLSFILKNEAQFFKV